MNLAILKKWLYKKDCFSFLIYNVTTDIDFSFLLNILIIISCASLKLKGKGSEHSQYLFWSLSSRGPYPCSEILSWESGDLGSCLSCMSEGVKSLSRVRLFATPWTVAHQALPSMGFSRQEYWSGLPFPSPGGSSQLRDRTRISCIAGRCFNLWTTREAVYWVWIWLILFSGFSFLIFKSVLVLDCHPNGPF